MSKAKKLRNGRKDTIRNSFQPNGPNPRRIDTKSLIASNHYTIISSFDTAAAVYAPRQFSKWNHSKNIMLVVACGRLWCQLCFAYAIIGTRVQISFGAPEKLVQSTNISTRLKHQ